MSSPHVHQLRRVYPRGGPYRYECITCHHKLKIMSGVYVGCQTPGCQGLRQTNSPHCKNCQPSLAGITPLIIREAPGELTLTMTIDQALRLFGDPHETGANNWEAFRKDYPDLSLSVSDYVVVNVRRYDFEDRIQIVREGSGGVEDRYADDGRPRNSPYVGQG